MLVVRPYGDIARFQAAVASRRAAGPELNTYLRYAFSPIRSPEARI